MWKEEAGLEKECKWRSAGFGSLGMIYLVDTGRGYTNA